MTREINGRIVMRVSDDGTRCAAECPHLSSSWCECTSFRAVVMRHEGGYLRAAACIAAEQAAALVPSWQPIETAPRDGTRVLVWGRHESRGYAEGVSVAVHVPTATPPHDVWAAHGGLVHGATNWMPLPEAPGVPASAQSGHLDGGARALDASEREGWSVCSHCGMVRNYDRETRTCSGALPKIRQRSEIEDCDHLSSENASLARQVESMAMRIESLAEELAKPEDVRLREVLDALDGRAVIFDGLGVRVTHLLDEMDEWIARAGAAERRLKKAEEVVMLARQLTAYSWEDRLEDCEVSDAAKHDSRELSTAIWFYDQEEKS